MSVVGDLLINQPDSVISLGCEANLFYCSSAGKYDEERLNFFVNTIYPYWANQRCTIHQLADYLSQFDIELRAYCPEEPIDDIDLPKNLFSFWLCFTKQWQGDIFVQCERLSQQAIH